MGWGRGKIRLEFLTLDFSPDPSPLKRFMATFDVAFDSRSPSPIHEDPCLETKLDTGGLFCVGNVTKRVLKKENESQSECIPGLLVQMLLFAPLIL